MATVVGTLELQMLANLARLQSDMTQAKGMVGSAMKNIESSVAMAKQALGALGIGLGVGYFVSLTKGAIDAADKFNDLTQSMGINRAELAKYQLATAQSGTTLEGLAKGVKGIATAFAEHGDGLRKAGITAKDTDGKMRQIADIFAAMPDGIEKTTLAVKLFGKSGMELIPMLNMGAAGLAETAEKSAKYAAVMATLAPQADKFNDTMVELGMASKVASMSLINDALPAMSKIAAAMALAAHESGSLKAAWVGFGGIAWEGVFKPLTALIKGTTANLMELNAKMLQFFGDNKGAAYEFQRAARLWKEVAALEDPAGPDAPKKEFDSSAWTKKYKEMLAALGLEKKTAGEKSNKDMQKLLDLGTKGEIDALTAREKAWADEQKAINDLKNVGYDEDKKLLDLGTKGEEEAALARFKTIKGELNALNDVRNAGFEADKIRQQEQLREQKHQSDEIDRMLGDAIMRGFERGESFAKNFWTSMVNMAKTVVLRPIISAVMSPVAGAITTGLGSMGLSTAANGAGSLGSAAALSSVGGWFGAAGGVPVTSTLGAIASGAGYAGAGSTGMMGAASGALAAIPVWGWAVLGAAAIAAYLSSGENERQRDLIATGVGGKISRGGLQGSMVSTWGTGTDDAWGGTTSGAIPSAALAAINNSINNIFTNMSAAAEKMGLSVAGLDSVMVDFGASWTNGDQTQADLTRAFNATSDAIALKLIPNIQSLQYQGETLTQTFSRLAAAQAALDDQRRTMEIALMEAQGKTIEALAAKRADELAAMDASLRPLQEIINLTEDWTTKLVAATSAASKAVDDQISTSQTASQTARAAADAYRQLNTTLADAVTQLRGGALSPLNPAQKLVTSGTDLNAIFSQAMTGDATALGKLPQAATDFLNASRAMNASGPAYTFDFNKVTDMLAQAQTASAAMVDWNQYQADVLDVHTGILTAIKDELSKPNPDTAILSEYTSQDVAVQQLIKEANESTSHSMDYLKLTGIKALFDLTSLISFVSDSSSIPSELRDLIKSGTKDFSVTLKAMLVDTSLSDAAKKILITGAGAYTSTVMAVIASDAATVDKVLQLKGLVGVTATFTAALKAPGIENAGMILALKDLTGFTSAFTFQINADLSPYQQLMDLQSMKDTTTTVTQYIDIVSRYATIGAPEAAAVAQAVTVAITTPTPAAVAAVVAAVAAAPAYIPPGNLNLDVNSPYYNPGYGTQFQAGASGGLFSGWTKVGEIGTEMVDFQTPGRVYTADQTRGMFAPQASDWRSGTQGITSEDLKALRADVQRLTAIVAAGDHANVQATERVSQSQENAAWRAEVRPVVK